MDQLHAAGMVGSHQLYHGLLSSCQAAGEWELALEVFLAMQVGWMWVSFGGMGLGGGGGGFG